MAYPTWLTPAGNLGIVPELEYYQLPMDAYDDAGGVLKYKLISGQLPPGIQVVNNNGLGYLQGIPVSTAGPDLNQTYSFTIRVTNQSDKNIADRTFQLTITNVAPPIITPRNVNLGTFFDGDVVNEQLEAVEFIQGAQLTWTLEGGTLPQGVTLSPSGLLSGIIYPIPANTSTLTNNVVAAGGFDQGQLYQIVSLGTNPNNPTDFTLCGATSNTIGIEFLATAVGTGTGLAAILDPAWDNTPWDELPWQSALSAIKQQFTFTIKVFDGVNFDLSTYQMTVIPKTALTADGTFITADITSIDGMGLTVDTGILHKPIIITTQASFPPERQGDWFATQIVAIDIDDDVLQYYIPPLISGAFDGDILYSGYPYLDAVVTNGNISVGVYPKSTTTTLGNTSRNGTGTFTSNTVTADYTQPNLISGQNIQVLQTYTNPTTEQPTLTWYSAVVNSYTTVVLSGNTIITGNAGQYLTQSISSANATISNVSQTTGTIQYDGSLLQGNITVYGVNSITANAGSYLTQSGSNANATITATVTAANTVSVTYNSGTFTTGSGNLQINGVALKYNAFNSNGNIWSNVNSYPTSTSISPVATFISAGIGDIITQNGRTGNATVVDVNLQNPYILSVRYNSGVFATGAAAGNLKLRGSNVSAYPTTVTCTASIQAQYNSAKVFTLNSSAQSAYAYIDAANTASRPTSITSVGVTISPNTPNEQSSAFDSGGFDQGNLGVPTGLTIDANSGWITGFLPAQTSNQVTYPFKVDVYKRDYPTNADIENAQYITSALYNLTILGSLNNYVTWLTPGNLGTIENGAVSDLSITAFSSVGKAVYYRYTPGAYISLPQGLELLPNGLISGRVSFEVFNLDGGQTTFDIVNTENGVTTSITTFDHMFEFSVDAITFDQTASVTQVFTLSVVELNLKPYENLYLKSYMTTFQRQEYQDIILNQNVFPPDLIFRPADPWFGLRPDITTLFLPGLNPSTADKYAAAVSTNHFGKRLLFGKVKTAVAREVNVYDVYDDYTGVLVGTFNQQTTQFIPINFSMGYTVSSTIPNNTHVGQQHIKYEVVYVDVLQENYPYPGTNNPNTIDLHDTIQNPYYDSNGNPYYIATPNSFSNMDDVVINGIGYANKSALPDWMTSVQPDGTVLGFKHATVLAYTEPGASSTIAWRFQQQGYDLNELNFTVDSYLLDNTYSANYDSTANAFINSTQTTFDRYPGLKDAFTNIGTVDYAISTSIEKINELSVDQIMTNGGLDGVMSFTSGQTLVFYKQEYPLSGNLISSYNQGWSDSLAPWDSSDLSVQGEWDYLGTEGWDASTYVPGYNEWLDQRVVSGNVTYYPTVNQRIGVWTININSNNYVTLTPTLTPVSYTANIAGNILTVASTVPPVTTGSPAPALYSGMMIYGNAVVGGTTPILSRTHIISQLTVAPSSATGGAGTYLISNSQTVGTTISPITIYRDMNYNDTLYVRQGYTTGGLRIYYDPTVKTGNTVPSWSVFTGIHQQITTGTIFDGGGTAFYDYRDSYTVPELGDSVVKFPHHNVFN